MTFRHQARIPEGDAQTLQYRREIEGLRAVAVLPVVLFHAKVPGFGGGFAGVDVFFVISGYLITLAILGAREATGFSLITFYERRARRLLPALIPVFAVSLLLAWLVMIPADYRQFSGALAASAGFAANVLFARRTDYFDSDEGLIPLLHMWSLSAEEQFYLLYPLVLLGLLVVQRKTGWKPLLLCGLASMAIGSFFLALWLHPINQPLAFFSLPTRAWELLAGALCALVPPARRHSGAAGLVGLALILTGFVFAVPQATPGWALLLPVGGAALVLRSASAESLAGKMLSLRPLTGIGMASYGIYLWHNPLLATADYIWFGEPPWWMTALAIALSLLLGFASLARIEQPVRAGKVLQSRWTLAAFCASGLAITIGIGLAGHLQWLTPRSFATSVTLANETPPGRDEGIVIPEGTAPIDLVIYGDSHAWQYYPALKQRFANNAALTVPGCLSLPNAISRDDSSPDTEACARLPRELETLASQRKVATVVWAQRWDRELFERGTLRKAGQSSGDGSASLREGIRQVRASLPASTRLILVGNVPTALAAGSQMDGGYLRCLAYLNVSCPTSFDRRMAEGHRINPLLKKLARELPETAYYDPEEVLCDAQGCALVRQGRSFYSDWSHLTGFAANRVVEQIAPLIAARIAERASHPQPER